MDYHERLEKLKLYRMERRRVRFFIINAWQQTQNYYVISDINSPWQEILNQNTINFYQVDGEAM